MQTLLMALELGAAIMAVAVVVRRHRKALRDHPPLAYEPGPVRWRWSTPPDGLTVRQAEGVSVVTLPPSPRGGAIAAEIAAYGLALLLIAMSVASVINDQPLALNLIGLALIGPLIPICLRMATRLTRIELRPERVTFIERGGLWWVRRRTWGRPIRVEGKMASPFETSKGRDPEHEIRLRAGLLGVRMRSACTQSMGSWIVGGLQAWSAESDASSTAG